MSENEEASIINPTKNLRSNVAKNVSCLLDQVADIFVPEIESFNYKYQEVQINLERRINYETKYRTQVKKSLFGSLFGVTEEVPYEERSKQDYYYARVRTVGGNAQIFRKRYPLGNYCYLSSNEFKELIEEEIIPDFKSEGWVVIGCRRINKGINSRFTYYLKQETKYKSTI